MCKKSIPEVKLDEKRINSSDANPFSIPLKHKWPRHHIMASPHSSPELRILLENHKRFRFVLMKTAVSDTWTKELK